MLVADLADAAIGEAVGAGAGGLIGHLWRGMSCSDMKELGEAHDEGEAALVVVGMGKLEEKPREELKLAARTYEKHVDAAEMRKELDKAIDEVKAQGGYPTEGVVATRRPPPPSSWLPSVATSPPPA